MQIGRLDLDTRFEYMIVYKDLRDNTINTWTLGESALRTNYKQMKESGNVEFLGIYKKLNDNEKFLSENINLTKEEIVEDCQGILDMLSSEEE